MTTVNLTNTSNNPPIQPAHPVKRFAKKAGRAYTALFHGAENAWNYIGKLSILSRNVMSASLRSTKIVAIAGKDYTKNVGIAASSLKLFSLISLPFTVVSIKNTSLKIFDHIRNRDPEGLVLSTLGLTLLAGDAVDTVTSCINTALGLASAPVVGLFSAIALPLGMSLASLGAVVRTISFGKSILLHHQIRTKVLSESDPEMVAGALKTFLEEKLSVTDEERLKILDKCKGDHAKAQRKIERLENRKKAALLRATSATAAKELTKLHKMLNIDEGPIDPNDLDSILKSIKRIQGSLTKKIVLDAASIFANLLTISALILFLTGVANPAPFILMAISIAIKLGVVAATDIHFINVKESIQNRIDQFKAWRAA